MTWHLLPRQSDCENGRVSGGCLTTVTSLGTTDTGIDLPPICLIRMEKIAIGQQSTDSSIARRVEPKGTLKDTQMPKAVYIVLTCASVQDGRCTDQECGFQCVTIKHSAVQVLRSQTHGESWQCAAVAVTMAQDGQPGPQLKPGSGWTTGSSTEARIMDRMDNQVLN